MSKADDRFVLRVTRDGSVHIEFGHSFSEADVPALVAAKRELDDLISRSVTGAAGVPNRALADG